MRLLSLVRTAAIGFCLVPLTTACTDELPTATGDDLFPGSARPVTLEAIFEADDFLVSDTIHTDYTSPASVGYLVAAKQFDGVLDANALALFTPFPDSVTYSTDSGTNVTANFRYTGGRVITVVNADASTSEPTQLRLWALEQAWDTAGVSWTSASEGTQWATAGGTRGALLAEAMWMPGDSVVGDTVAFALDSAVVAQMAAEGYRGLLVSSETEGSRLEMSRLVLRAEVRPAAHPDTVVAQSVTAGPQTFIHTPDPTGIAEAFRVGGARGERTVLTLDLNQQVPGCIDPATTPNCPSVSLADVMINEAALRLQLVNTGSGLRPLKSPDLRVRRVVEPELGRQAPLGELLYADTIAASRFLNGDGEEIDVTLSNAVSIYLRTEQEQLTVALLTNPEGAQFGTVQFAERPRLRIVYTLPLRPNFP